MANSKINADFSNEREKRLAELEAANEEIDRKLRNLKANDNEYRVLMERFLKNIKEELKLFDESVMECRALFEENCRLEAEIAEKGQELKETYVHDKLALCNKVLENPQNFSEKEIAEAQSFAEEFIKITEEYAGM